MADMVISVQHVELNTSSAATVSGVLIYGQDTSNCVPFVTAHCAGADDIREGFFDVYFGVESATGSGTINCEFFENSGSNKHIHAYIVEFDPAQVKVQQGTFDMASVTTDDITLSGIGLDSVDDGYTAMTHYYKSSTDTDSWSHHCISSRITTSGTNVLFQRGGASGNINGHYYLFEALNNQFSVQGELTNSMAGATTTYMDIDWVNWNKSFILSSYYTDVGNSCLEGTVRVSLVSPTEIQYNRGSSTNTIDNSAFVVSFNDDTKHVQRYFQSFGTSQTVLTVDLNESVDLDYSMSSLVNYRGIQRTQGTATTDPDSAFFSIKFNSSSQIEIERNSTGSSDAAYTAWEVIDWIGKTVTVGTNPSPLNPSFSCAKSVERVSINVDLYYTDYNLTLGQDVANCVPFLSKRGSGVNDLQYSSMCDVWLTSPGLISAYRRSTSGDLLIEAHVVEFYPDQVRVQQGIVEITNGSNEGLVTISGVDQTKAVLIFNGAIDTSSDYWNHHAVRGRFTSDTQLQFYRGGTSGDWEGHYYVFEDLSDNFDVQAQSISMTGVNVSMYVEDEMKRYSSFLIYSYYTDNASDAPFVSTIAMYWSDINRFYAHRQASTGNIYIFAQAVRFLDDRLRTYWERPNLNAVTTYSGTVPSYYKGNDNSLIAFCTDASNSTGAVYNNTSTSISEMCAMVTLEDSSSWFQVTKNAASYNGYYPFTFIDWVGYKKDLTFSTPTTSFIRSITKKTFSMTAGSYEFWLDEGQIPSNCVPFVTMRAIGTGGQHRQIITGIFIHTNGLVGIYRVSSTGTIEFNMDILEFDPDQVKVQSGSFYTNSTSVTKSIEAVDLNKAFVISYYYNTSNDAGWDTQMMMSEFTSVSGVEISRYSAAGTIMGYYYVVEALGDQFKVHNIDFEENTFATTIYANHPSYELDTLRTMFIASYRTELGSNRSDYAAYRFYQHMENRVVLNKQLSGSTELNAAEVYAIEFNENLGVRILQRSNKSLSGATTSVTYTFDDAEAFDTTRSIVHNPMVQNTSRNNGTNAATTEATFHRMYFTTVSGNEITIDRSAAGSPTGYHSFQAIEFPEYKTHYFEGVVQEEGSEVAREVQAYRTDTYELVDSTTSTVVTGAYRLETSYSGIHHIVCRDDADLPDYNDLILGKMVPTPIT